MPSSFKFIDFSSFFFSTFLSGRYLWEWIFVGVWAREGITWPIFVDETVKSHAISTQTHIVCDIFSKKTTNIIHLNLTDSIKLNFDFETNLFKFLKPTKFSFYERI